jgi:trimeric autotransporter adhesin
MAITVKHSKVSTIPDEADTSLVRPSDWNADHTLTGTIDIANGGTGQTTANAAFNALVPSQTGNTGKYLTTDGTDTSWATNPLGTVTSVNLTASTGISVSGGPITTSGSITVTNTAPDQTVVLNSGTGISTSGTYPNFTVTNTAPDQTVSIASGTGISTSGTYPAFTVTNTGVTSAVAGTGISVSSGTGAVTVTNTAPDQTVAIASGTGISVTGTYPNFTVTNTSPSSGGTVTSVGLTTSSAALALTNTPITSSGNIGVNFSGLSSQYVRGDGALANFPTTGGGGSSVAYYFNGSVNQGTFGGATYYEMSKTPIFGAGTNFSLNADGYIAQFITDANDPSLLAIPAGSWNIQLYFSTSSAGGSPSYYVELYKYNGTTFTLIASNSANPEGITGGVSTDLYSTSLGVPATTLAVTDRLAMRVYVTHSGRTITLHTEGSTLCEVVTTFSTGLNALNGLTAQVQYFATGTSGSDFNISSATDTHTFNLPSASGSNRGLLTSADWTTFNSKVTSVSGTAPVVSSGGTTPAISMAKATTSVDGYLSATDFTTFNNKGNGTVTSVSALTLGTTGTDLSSTVANGTTTPVITLNVPTASATNRGALSSADWTTFNSKAAPFTYTSTYIPFGQGTTTPNQSANLTFDGTSLTAPVQRASNGIVTNNKTIGTSFTIPSTDNAMSSGPVTLSAGVTVTVSSGSRWVVL